MGDPADIGPQYRCEECGVWGPDTTCVQCGAELGEDVRGVPGVYAKKVIAEGHVAPRSGGDSDFVDSIKFFFNGTQFHPENVTCLVGRKLGKTHYANVWKKPRG